ncbi:PilW family protein [Paraherbaspirillum soli]|uniref:PilW family protein n=1 Tax=Paraherbaspirillum soli TaxID=631222 RepID=A0ABW0M645_9BURK
MRTKQHGIGLIELMVAMTISLFLMIGLGSAYFGMRQNSISRSGLSQLQDQQRTAMTLIAGAVQQAGFFPTPLTNTNATVFLASQSPFTVAGTPVTGTASSFSVRYVTAAAAPLPTCAGLSSGAATYVDTYSVSTDGSNTLNCAETVNGVAATTQSLVGGVASMQVLFGVDTDGKGSAYQYQAASAVLDWSLVKSAQVTLNFNNPLNGQPGQPATIPFTRTIGLMNTL